MSWEKIKDAGKFVGKRVLGPIGVALEVISVIRTVVEELDRSGYEDQAYWVCQWQDEIDDAKEIYYRRLEWAVKMAHWSAFAMGSKNFEQGERNRDIVLRQLEKREDMIPPLAVYAINFNENFIDNTERSADQKVHQRKDFDRYYAWQGIEIDKIFYSDSGQPAAYRDPINPNKGHSIPKPNQGFRLPASRTEAETLDAAKKDREKRQEGPSWEEALRAQRAYETAQAEDAEYKAQYWTPTSSEMDACRREFAMGLLYNQLKTGSARKCSHEAARVMMFQGYVFEEACRGAAD